MGNPKNGGLEVDEEKLRQLTMACARIQAAADALDIDPGDILRDDFVATPADQISWKARLARWRALYQAREVIFSTTGKLRDTAARLEARYGMSEEQLCGLSKAPLRESGRTRPATPAKA